MGDGGVFGRRVYVYWSACLIVLVNANEGEELTVSVLL